ncbi:hypothetical protein MTX20_00430 (plasmid) [Bradyrhizobium sp. ISRA435]|nr:hypothetical protein MTX20_00430 [Bradyrhizobium sp. ISRA435]
MLLRFGARGRAVDGAGSVPARGVRVLQSPARPDQAANLWSGC